MKYELEPKKRYLLRIIIPAYPAFNVYSVLADKTTALGPLYVGSSAQEVEKWDVEIIDENNLRRFGPKDPERGANHNFLQKQRPADVVGFYGGLTSTIPRVYELAKFYKNQGAITIAGGQHFVPETLPEGLSSGLDLVVLGEGEETIKELLSAFAEGKKLDSIAGLAYKKDNKIFYTAPRPTIQDLDKIPIPDLSLLRYAKVALFPVGRVRGCGMNCEFCAVKGRARYASPEHLVGQIRKAVETLSAREFFIVDDLFGQDRNETLRLCKLLKEYQEFIGRSLKLTVQIRLDKAKDTELLQAMREANIGNICIGIESPIDEELKAMRKGLRAEDMLAMAKVFHNLGFFIHGMFIFGYPMREGIKFNMPIQERIKHFRRFINKARLDTIQVLLPVPLPGTEMRARLLNQNRVYPVNDLGWEYYDGNFPLIEFDESLVPEEVQMGVWKIMSRFYQSRHLINFLFTMFSIPHLILYFHRLKIGWRKWYRKWRTYAYRIGGAKIIKKWTQQFYKGPFFEKLQKAKRDLKSLASPQKTTQ
ncbi:MAG: radical SAM protein [Candidatus Omnitrophota bacterium]|nr:MAG: radical SAM protein [Candidatus Omnitrophota bacterium]